MPARSLRKHAQHIDKRLRFRMRIYFLIAVIFIGIFIWNILRGSLRFDYGMIGITSGILIGIITSRMYHLSWDHDAKKIVSRLDAFGIAILIFYITIEVFREKIVSYFTHDVQVGTVGFALLSGIILGQFLGTGGKIKKILKEQKVFG